MPPNLNEPELKQRARARDEDAREHAEPERDNVIEMPGAVTAEEQERRARDVLREYVAQMPPGSSAPEWMVRAAAA